VRYFFLIIALFVTLISKAQLSAPGMSTVRYTSYPAKDPVYIYCNVSGSQKGTLNASSPGGTAPFTYKWYKWNDINKSFETNPFKTESGVITSSVNNLDEGSYQVVFCR